MIVCHPLIFRALPLRNDGMGYWIWNPIFEDLGSGSFLPFARARVTRPRIVEFPPGSPFALPPFGSRACDSDSNFSRTGGTEVGRGCLSHCLLESNSKLYV